MRHAWEISPALAVQMSVRFKHPVINNELQTLLLNNTADAVHVSDALQFLLDDKLMRKDATQLKVRVFALNIDNAIPSKYFPLVVPTLLGTRITYHCNYVFFACIFKPPIALTICNACVGISSCRHSFFLYPASCAGFAI